MNNSWPPQRKGADNPRSLFSESQVEMMRDRHEIGGVTIKQLAEETGASHTTISRILRGDRYPDHS